MNDDARRFLSTLKSLDKSRIKIKNNVFFTWDFTTLYQEVPKIYLEYWCDIKGCAMGLVTAMEMVHDEDVDDSPNIFISRMTHLFGLPNIKELETDKYGNIGNELVDILGDPRHYNLALEDGANVTPMMVANSLEDWHMKYADIVKDDTTYDKIGNF